MGGRGKEKEEKFDRERVRRSLNCEEVFALGETREIKENIINKLSGIKV